MRKSLSEFQVYLLQFYVYYVLRYRSVVLVVMPDTLESIWEFHLKAIQIKTIEVAIVKLIKQCKSFPCKKSVWFTFFPRRYSLQQDGATSHTACETIEFIENSLPDYIVKGN